MVKRDDSSEYAKNSEYLEPATLNSETNPALQKCYTSKNSLQNKCLLYKSVVNGNSTDKALSDISTVSSKLTNGFSAANGHCTGETSTCNGNITSEAPLENTQVSNSEHKDESSNEVQDENPSPFIEVKPRKNRKRSKTIPNRPIRLPCVPAGYTRKDDRNDGNREKESYSSKKSDAKDLPVCTKFFSPSRVNGESFSSKLANGRKGSSPLTNNTKPSPCAQQVVSNILNNHNSSLSDRVLANTSKSVANNKLNVPCPQKDSITGEIKDASIQTENSPQNEDISSHSDVEVSSIGEITTSSSGAYCDSVASNDSRNSGSENKHEGLPHYCFEFPANLVGLFLGNKKVHKHELIRKSGVAELVIHNLLVDEDEVSFIELTGTNEQIESAKSIIRKRFPLKHYPEITLECVAAPTEYIQLAPEYYARLVEGTFFPGIVRCANNPSQFWVQQFDHPLFYKLEKLERDMSHYFNNPDAPRVHNPFIGNVVAVPFDIGSFEGWWRAIITFIDPEKGSVHVKSVDHGGIYEYAESDIRQMNSEFLKIPFFASECALYDAAPLDGIWSDEAMTEFQRLCHNGIPSVKVMQKVESYFYYVQVIACDPDTKFHVDVAFHLKNMGLALPSMLPVDVPFQHQQWLAPATEGGPLEPQQWPVPAAEGGQMEPQQWPVAAAEDGQMEPQQWPVAAAEDGQIEQQQWPTLPAENGQVEQQLPMPPAEEGEIRHQQLSMLPSEGQNGHQQLSTSPAENNQVEHQQQSIPSAEEDQMKHLQLSMLPSEGQNGHQQLTSPAENGQIEHQQQSIPSAEEGQMKHLQLSMLPSEDRNEHQHLTSPAENGQIEH